MKLLVYSDLQGTDGDESCRSDPTQSLQHYRIVRFYADLERIYTEHKCQGVIDLGDTTDDRASIPMPTIDAVGAGLERIPDSEYNFKLTGNHEHFLRNTTINNRHLFKHKFTVIDNVAIYDIDGINAVFCSYPASMKELAEWLHKNVKSFEAPAALFGHFQVAGCKLNNGTALDGIPQKLLAPFACSLLGHIHIPHSIGEDIHYVGSPFQQDWGEAGQKKRVAIFNTEHEDFVEWVPLAGYPEYRQVAWDKFKTLKNIEEHRYRVLLRSHEETELFFQHPLFQQVEPVYEYDAAVTEELKTEQNWTFDGIVRRYMALVPPNKIGIDIEAEEVLSFGIDLANGQL